MTLRDAIETAIARALVAGVRSVDWRRSLSVGARLGEGIMALGVRRAVATANLALAFPERSEAERHAILREHYRELGRVAAEYARLAELVRSDPGEVIAEVRGLEHLLAARAAGRGAILLTGHFGNFELGGAWLGRWNPVEFVVRPLRNPGVEDLIARERRAAGVGIIPLGAGIRRVRDALAANHWIPMLADQDARRHGAFVPFFGRLASTPTGPARISLATGAPIVMGFIARREDGRHQLEIDPPLEAPRAGTPDAAERLTALYTARLEARVRARPAAWFWLHRRWKTAPPAAAAEPARAAGRMAAG